MMKSWTPAELYSHIKHKLKADFPRVRIIPRRNVWWARVMDVFGGTSTYTTTIYRTIAVTNNWAQLPTHEKAAILWHEYQHLCQARRWGRGSDWIGWFVTYGPVYLFVLPAVFTMRARFEREAYAEQLRVDFTLERGLLTQTRWTQWMCDVFAGPVYAWMWPFKRSVRRWGHRTYEQMRSQKQAGIVDRPFRL